MPGELQIEAGREEHKYYPYTGIFYANRHSFWQAGQDSFTLPPAQNPDMFQSLLNVEPVLQGILQRRRGYTIFNQNATSVTTGSQVPTVAANVPIFGGFGNPWSNPNNALVLDGAVAVVSLNGAQSSQHLQVTGFGFSIPASAFVTNVAVSITSSQSRIPTRLQPLLPLNASLISGGNNVAGSVLFFPNSQTLTTQTLNFSGATAALVNAATFGVDILGNIPPGFGSDTFSVDAVTVSVTYSLQSLFTLGYSFRSENLGIRKVVFTSPFDVQTFTETGIADSSPLFIPSAGAGKVRMVLSRDYGYFADGIGSDYKKWNGQFGPGTLTNWGIAVSNSTGGGGNSTAPPTVAANDSSGTVAWTNPSNCLVQDGNDASIQLTQNQVGDNLLATGFGFTNATVPNNSTILRITVSGTGFVTSTGGFFPGISFTLLRNGVPTGQTQSLTGSVGIPLNSNGSFTLSFVPSSWGYNWTPADVQNANFGVAIGSQTFAIVDTETWNIDSVNITVVFSSSTGGGGSITVGTPGAGNITLLNGRTYFYAFLNSKTGHVSNIGPPSLSTGPLTSNNVPLSTIPVSNDPQVDTVILLATADGNDQTTLFQLTTLPNGTTSYLDNTPDALTAAVTFGPALLSNPLYLDTDQFGTIHGVANNNPPPTINFPTKHKGRIYGSVGRALFFSKNLDEVTTANGLITSKWEEAWPATNQFDISEQAETIQGLLTDGETLWIATERAIRRLIGDSPINFQKPEVQFNETGLLNQETWKVVFMEGQPVGTMWMTPDFRVIGSDFNTYLDVGTPIQDVLNTVNSNAAQTAHAVYVNKGPADYYMLYIPTGSNTSPDTCCVYNLRSKKWFIWQPTDQVTASLFLFDALGQPRWLFASALNNLYEWTSGTFQDRIGTANPATYQATIQTSWLDLGDYTLRKFVNQIIPTTADQTALTIAVDAASNELDFNSPLSVVTATTVIPAAIPTDVFVPLASGPSHSRAFRFTFVSPPSAIGNVLTGFSIEAGSFHKY